ncbi:copper chaperone PCu(A)C [Acrocarpospora catenulata]|uniref:copper chaperone PCu(A)C n=1 Tax=Acrocarpospora catenulata TaxID=2836182 RepID=UPI001BD99F63|nr:copper chaperone PCu(A)C [Acrocarpospora catenulata]
MSTRHAFASLALAAVAAASACGSHGAASSVAAAVTGPIAPVTSSSTATATALTITDPWVKTTKEGMTAAFGTLVNHSGTDIVVVSASTPFAPKAELHEVVNSGGKTVMQPKKGGFLVPAHGTHVLKPGGDHIMLMGVTKEVKPGAEIPFTLTLKDGSTFKFNAVGKPYAGAKENYQPGGSHG